MTPATLSRPLYASDDAAYRALSRGELHFLGHVRIDGCAECAKPGSPAHFAATFCERGGRQIDNPQGRAHCACVFCG